MKDINTKFKTAVKKHMQTRNLTATTLAQMAGIGTVKAQRISNLNDSTRVTLEDAQAIAECLDTTIFMMTGSGAGKRIKGKVDTQVEFVKFVMAFLSECDSKFPQDTKNDMLAFISEVNDVGFTNKK